MGEGRLRPVTKVSPSILSADFADLGADAVKVYEFGAEWLHVDVMDGHFVPNLTMGPPIVASLRKRTKAFLDCHLMVSDPEAWVEPFKEAGADGYTFHLEAVAATLPPSEEDMNKVRSLCRKIRAAGMNVGIALKPNTAAEHVTPLLDEQLVDLVLCLTVEPGFGGQKFMPEVMPKVKTLRCSYPGLDIEVDGGIGPKTIDAVAEAGANVLVSGSAVFLADDPKQVITQLYNTCEAAAA